MVTASRRSLLIVEDDPDLRMTLEYFLGKIGYQVLSASDGIEGLKLCLEKRPRAVLLDVMMAGMNGFEVCAKIKGDPITQSATVILMTAKKAAEVYEDGSKAGAEYWIQKPADPNDVGADLYLLFEKDFAPLPEDIKKLRVTKAIPHLAGSTMNAYQRAGMDSARLHAPPQGYAQEHSHTDNLIHGGDHGHHHAQSHSHEPAPASGHTGGEVDKIHHLLVALRDSLKDTGSRLDAVIQYIDILEKK